MILAGPVVDPDEARVRIREELGKSEYDDSEGFVSWLLRTIEEWLLDLTGGIDGSSTLQGGIAVVIIIALLVVAVLVLRRTGLLRRGHTLAVPAALDAQQDLSAAELRAASRSRLDQGQVDEGAVLALRALVRDLEDRTLLDVSEGMTAHEAAERASRPFPDLRGRLLRGADAFDMAAYSHRSASGKQAEDLLRLAEFIAESTPDLAAAEGSGGRS